MRKFGSVAAGGAAEVPQGPLSPAETRALAALTATLAVTAVALAVAGPGSAPEPIDALAHALVVVTPVAVGLYALHRGAATRFAFLLIAAGFFWAPTLLTMDDKSLPFTIGRVWAWLLEVALIYLVLAFPTGRLTTRFARRLTVAAVCLAATLYLPTALFVDHFPAPSPWDACDAHCPANAFMVTATEPGVISSVVVPIRELLLVALYLAVAGYLVSRIIGGSRALRWVLVPVLAVAVLRMLATGAFLIARRAEPGGQAADVLGLIALFCVPGTAAALLAGLVRWRIQATRALRRLTAELGPGLSASRARDLIAEAIGDPSLQILYWSSDPGHWVDSEGTPTELPPEEPDRAVAEIWAGGHLVAGLITDVTILSEPAVAEVARGFALMALENRRLDAELGSSLRELRESRARVLAAADSERTRIERDLHDGAQQRLVALRVGLELAAEALKEDPQRAGRMLDRLGTEMDEAVNEVRMLARGMSPPLLADHGLAEALRGAARRSTLKAAVLTRSIGRYSPDVEGAVYFCCLEALQNAEKHAHAQSCDIRIYEDDELHFEITDDGVGINVDAPHGHGLANMRDRMASVRGQVRFEPASGGGTRVFGSVPVGLARLSPDVEMLLQRATDVFQDCFAIYNAVRDSNGEPIDFVVEHVNNAACRDAGLPRELHLGRTLTQLRPDYLGDQLISWHLEALVADGPSATEKVAYRSGPNGARSVMKAYDVRAAPLGGGRLAVTWRDITQRKRADEDLLAQAAIQQRGGEGLCMVRVSDRAIIYSNARFAEILGYPVAELEGMHLTDLSWGEDEGEARLRLAELERAGEVSYEVRARRRDGVPLWLAGRAATFVHADHGAMWIIVLRDVTARRETPAALGLTDGPL